MNKKAALVGGIGLGAALMYLFDPDRGKRRRGVIRDKVESAANKTGDYAGKVSRDLRDRAYGMVAETKSIFSGGSVSDDTLTGLVHNKLGEHSLFIGPIDATVENGVVTLRGPILATEVPDVLKAVHSIRGVQGLDNQLAVHADPLGESELRETETPFGGGLESATARGI